MRIIVIGSRSHGAKNDPSVIAAALRESGHEVDCYTWEALHFDIQTGDVQVFHNDEAVFSREAQQVIALGWYKSGRKSIYRDVAFAFGLVAKKHNIPIWNSEILHQRSTTKLSCMVQLALEGIDVPLTEFSLESTSLIEARSLPFIAKAVSASRGAHNYLVDSETARRLAVNQADVQFLMQPFLPNDHDLRIICFDGQPQLALRRTRAANSSTHLNNTTQGARAEWVELSDLPEAVLTKSRKICSIMSREMAGIDFIPDVNASGGYSCLEVNAVPQLTSGFGVETKMQALVQALKDKQESEKV